MSKKSKKRHLNSLQPGSELHWYEIREILGQGGFGITYLADDKNLAHEVAIKEYMPVDLATRGADGDTVEPLSQSHHERFLWGLERFIEEARTLGLFNHPNIVRVRNVFQTNNTAYMVMDYELGESLQDILNRRKILDEDDIGTVIFPIIDGMKQVHAHGFIHRDIKPANIFIRVDGDPVLLDFGSARQALSEQQQSLTSIFSKGYAPIEQYSTDDEQQGAWTDIYAFGATMYRAVAGVPPSDAINRSTALSLAARDTFVSAVEIGAGRYSNTLLEAIDAAMQFKHQDRPQTITEWQSTFIAARPVHLAAAQQVIKKEEDPLAEQIRAAESGDVSAQSTLAFIYAKGDGTPVNDDEAFKWFTKAAEQGDAISQFNLGVMYAKGRSADQDYNEAFKWYKKAAEQGDFNSQATISMMYMKGIGTEKDHKAAFDWSLRAAKRGHLNSIFNLGEFYANGYGVEKNPTESFRWNKKAALKGHVNAQLNLGYMYGKGEGVKRDDTEAFHWYRKAAESGHPNAQFNLGVIYAKGRGVSSNIEEARIWYRLADEQGVEQAGRALARLNK